MSKKQRKSNARSKALQVLLLLPLELFKATINKVKNLGQETVALGNTASINIVIALTLFINWAMQFRLVQVIVNFAKKIGRAIQIILSGTSIKFKTFVVNNTSIKVFVLVARVLPIGGWLKYEEQDEVGYTTFSWAITQKDHALLDRILKVITQEALYRFLFMTNCFGIGALQTSVSFSEGDTTETRKIVDAIKPDKRLWVFNRLMYNNELLIFSLVREKHKAAHCELIMQSLPEKDKIHFMNQVNSNGSSPVLLQAMGGESWEQIKTFLDHYPKEILIDYLNLINDRKETFFTEAASHHSNIYVDKIIELVPEEKRAAYLSKYHQGLKALLYAKANYHYYHHQIPVLKNLGIKMPEQFEALTPDELKKRLPKIFEDLDATEELDMGAQWIKNFPNEHAVIENFKLQYGVYPLSVLNIDKKEEISLSEIKSAYRKLMLFCHPDKNKGSEESTTKSRLVNEAYGVYTKPDIRKKYYHV